MSAVTNGPREGLRLTPEEAESFAEGGYLPARYDRSADVRLTPEEAERFRATNELPARCAQYLLSEDDRPPVDDGVEALRGRIPPRIELKEWSVSELVYAAEDADRLACEWHIKGDEVAANAWGDRWIEIADELERRKAQQAPKKTTKPAATPIRGARAPQRRGLLPGEWSYAKVPRAIFRDPGLPMAAKMAACALADALNVNGRSNAARVIKISYDALAAKMGANRETARVATARLEAAGWITKASGRGHGANRYRFTSKARGDAHLGEL